MKVFTELAAVGLNLAGPSAWIYPRLVLAAVLGGAVGLERETRHKPAGLRTQMFICLGAAFFTVLSNELAGSWGGDHTRIASQIIPGIGFIGAGSILRERGSVTGLTSAASIFVVASIGMAAGGGLYVPAVFATLLTLLCLHLLGWAEERFSLKPLVMVYEVNGADMGAVVEAVNNILLEQQKTMRTIHLTRIAGRARVRFSVDASRREHDLLLQRLRQTHVFENVQSLGASDNE